MTEPSPLFLLGTHEPSWLARANVPLFVSHRRLSRYRHWSPAVAPWAVDSGGFTELSMHGEWRTTPAAYVAAVVRYRDEIGRLLWAAPQDHMCEPFILDKTGGTVIEHQQRTVANYCELRTLDASLPFVPVVQGWQLDDYLRCVDMYAAAGVDLDRCAVVGVGSVCRRQSTDEIATIVDTLAALGLRLHGFGIKQLGLRKYARSLVSCDSLAWSYNARKRAPLPGCSHRSCSSCLRWALRWRLRLLADVGATTNNQPEGCRP